MLSLGRSIARNQNLLKRLCPLNWQHAPLDSSISAGNRPADAVRACCKLLNLASSKLRLRSAPATASWSLLIAASRPCRWGSRAERLHACYLRVSPVLIVLPPVLLKHSKVSLYVAR